MQQGRVVGVGDLSPSGSVQLVTGLCLMRKHTFRCWEPTSVCLLGPKKYHRAYTLCSGLSSKNGARCCNHSTCGDDWLKAA